MRLNILEQLLETLPRLRRVVLTDPRSARITGLTEGPSESELSEWTEPDRWNVECHRRGLGLLVYLIGTVKMSGIENIAVGSYLLERSMACIEGLRSENSIIGDKSPGRSLLSDINTMWREYRGEVSDAMQGLRTLHLRINASTYRLRV